MAEQTTFVRYVHEVFAHLDDRTYLTLHPLASLIAAGKKPASPEALRRAVLSAIEELKPPEGTVPGTPIWRRWMCLTLRYVDGATTKQIARELRISERQALRDHLRGIDAVAAVLWSRLAEHVQRHENAPSQVVALGESERQMPVPARQDDLETELARVATPPRGEGSNVGEALQGALVTVHRLLEERGARFEIAVPSDLQPAALSPTVVRQAFLCLVTALALSKGGSTIRVQPRNTSSGVEVVFSLRSRTSVVPPATGPADEETSQLLDAARRLVEPEGGALRIYDSAVEPLRFVLSLPTTRAITILVVDDNPDMGELFRWYLAGGGYYVVQARTPPTALELAKSLAPDVIILDVMMPSQDGWQIFQQLRDDSTTSGVPVIVCSILPAQPVARSLGIADFLTKPVTKSSLQDAVERCLARRGAQVHPGSRAGTSSSPQP